MIFLDIGRPYTRLDYHEKGESKIDPETSGADWVEQDGKYFCWSESNCAYELAWWLYTHEQSSAVRYLRETRKPPEKQRDQ